MAVLRPPTVSTPSCTSTQAPLRNLRCDDHRVSSVEAWAHSWSCLATAAASVRHTLFMPTHSTGPRCASIYCFFCITQKTLNLCEYIGAGYRPNFVRIIIILFFFYFFWQAQTLTECMRKLSTARERVKNASVIILVVQFLSHSQFVKK